MAYGDRSGNRDRSSGGRRSFGDRSSGSSRGGSGGSYGGRGRSGGYSGQRSFDRGPREMHKTTCADCGKECEVPFKPTEGRPVYCRDCFAKHRDDNPSSRGPSRRPPRHRDDDE